MQTENGADPGNASALERARQISQALAEAARRARFSTRSRRTLSSGGFQARRGATLMRILSQTGFVVLVLIPTVVSTVYFGLIASDQYVAEAQFTVTGGNAPPTDALGSAIGLPAMAIVQDTQIVVNYIESRAAVEKLDRILGLRDKYSDTQADFFARFDRSGTIEELVRYWKSMVDASIRMPSGIVVLRVRAFTPDDAVALAEGAVQISETLINELNQRMNDDAVRSAAQELDRASARLKEARIALEIARNERGILDVNRSAEMANRLLTDLRSSLLALQREFSSQRSTINETAPQMRALKSRIATTQSQIDEIEANLTRVRSGTEGQTLAQSMSAFAELDLERQIAERLYNGAAAALETARMTAEHKTMYLNAFLRPGRPEKPQYPRRMLHILATSLGGILIWGILRGIAVAIRDHMA
jgi:capsular polysaccharide transport system permease protein